MLVGTFQPDFFTLPRLLRYAVFGDKQTDLSITGLKETDAYPAMPEDG